MAQPRVWLAVAAGAALLAVVGASSSDDDLNEQRKHELAGDLAVVMLAMVLAYAVEGLLDHKGIWGLPGSGATILIGMVVGAVMVAADGNTGAHLEDFNSSLFMLALLPVIIFDAGYGLRKSEVFVNMPAILTFSIAGTAISAFVTAPAVFAVGPDNFTSAEAMAFAALIAAVDPVATLAVFQHLKVEPDLNALCVGESVINDAVSVVLFRASSHFIGKTDVGADDVLKQIGLFVLICIASVVLGYVSGLLCALCLRYLPLSTAAQVLVMLVWSYFAFLTSEGLEQSGIVASLVCGFTMKRYCWPNLTSNQARQLSLETFHMLASAAETFIFLNVGTSVVTRQKYPIGFTLLTVVMCWIGRFINIFGLGGLLNFKCRGERTERVSFPYRCALVHSGLRGAVAFAIAWHFPDTNGHRDHVINATAGVIFFTVFVQGGTTVPVLKALGIKTNVSLENDAKRSRILKAADKNRLLACLRALDERVMPIVSTPGGLQGDFFVQTERLTPDGADPGGDGHTGEIGEVHIEMHNTKIAR